MSLRRKLPVILIPLWLLLDAIAYSVGILIKSPEVIQCTSLVLHAQFAALAGWIVVGDSWRRTTGLVLIAGIVFGQWWVSTEWLGPELLIDYFWAALYISAVIAPLAALRLSGWSLRYDSATRPARRLQFSLRELLLLMVACILLALCWRTLGMAPPTPQDQMFANLGRVIFLILFSAYILPWSAWLLTFLFRPLHAWLLGAVAYVLLGFMYARYVDAKSPAEYGMAGALLLWGAIFFLHVCLLRHVGWRWIWERPKWLARCTPLMGDAGQVLGGPTPRQDHRVVCNSR